MLHRPAAIRVGGLRAPGFAAAVAAVFAAVFAVMGMAERPAHASTLPGGFAESQVAHPLTRPTSMAFTPDGRILVNEQAGRMRVVKNGALLSTPAITLPVDSSGERGLLGVAVDPSFASNGWVYVYYTTTTPTTHNRVSRFTMTGDVLDPSTERVLLDIDDLSSLNQHNAGDLKFAPDGKLFIAVGDNQDSSNAQSLTTLKGKVLRINADGTIPADNPLVSKTTGKYQAIYGYGFRNPFTFDIQPGTGRVYVDDVGQDSWEEINELVPGGNYGWPTTEGYTSDPAFVSPVYAYAHGSDSNTGCAITGGAFYNPAHAQFPSDYVGKYFFVDMCMKWLKTIDPTTHAVADFGSALNKDPVSVTLGPDGSLYYLSVSDTDSFGSVYKISYTGSLAPSIGTQPQSQLVSTGYGATLNVSASGYPTLAYQWYQDGAPISGATGPSYTTPQFAPTDDGKQYTYRVAVTNAYGSATSADAVVTVTADQPPQISIDTPAAGTHYNAGDTISYSGSATDLEDGTLAPSAYTWRVDFGHHLPGTPNSHFHPFIPDTPGSTSGSFTIPTGGETDPDVYYRIILTVTDSKGLVTTTYRDVVPNTAKVTLASSPSGMLLKLDGSPVTAPYTFTGVVGIRRTVDVFSPQTVSGIVYGFGSWSDGGAAQHTIVTPATDTTYTATFPRVPPQGTISATPNPIQACDGSGKGTTSLTWTTSGVTAVEAHLNSPSGPTFAVTGPGTETRVTGNWVTDGMVFYLQDTSGGLPLTAANTLATVTVHLTSQGCVSGTLSASPNPVQVCDGAGVAATTLTWTTTNTTTVEVHVSSPTGPTFAVTGPGTVSRATGNWVTDGMVFYLQDVSAARPGTTLATVTVHFTVQGCPVTGSISANPNPIQVCNTSGVGTTALTWTTTGTTKVEVHLNSTTGPLFAVTGAGAVTRTTGNWVTDGMTFYLQNTSAGSPGQTMATAVAHLTKQGCPPGGAISANPNPIVVCNASGQGSTVVSWQAWSVSAVEVHLGSPSGKLFSKMGPGPVSKDTGPWVSEGTVFYLQNTSGGLPLTAANTLATVTVHVTSSGCP